MLHVGLPKTGTTYLQALLAENRDRLRAAGVLYPFIRPGRDVPRGGGDPWQRTPSSGCAADEVAGTWAALCKRAREYDGTTVISHEVLAGATPEQIRTALEPLAGIDVQVVVTARDLGRQAVAHWQEEVKLGATYSFADFEASELRADTGPGAGPDDGGDRPHFWHAQDFADCLRRWSVRHRATSWSCRAPGASPVELWRRFADAVGRRPGRSRRRLQRAGQPVARRRRDRAAPRGERRARRTAWTARTYNRVVKREYAEEVLAAGPARARARRTTSARCWRRRPRRGCSRSRTDGCVVHGDLDDLTPVLADPDDPRPDDVELTEDPKAVAARLIPAPVERGPRWRGPFRR